MTNRPTPPIPVVLTTGETVHVDASMIASVAPQDGDAPRTAMVNGLGIVTLPPHLDRLLGLVRAPAAPDDAGAEAVLYRVRQRVQERIDGLDAARARAAGVRDEVLSREAPTISVAERRVRVASTHDDAVRWCEAAKVELAKVRDDIDALIEAVAL